jgi:hypothetical protein
MRAVAPSIFAGSKHESRSARYAYIPTIEVLRGLAKEGFRPYMVAQGSSRIEGRGEYTKHLVRLRHARENGPGQPSSEANEIILINSHDGASSYQMLAGQFRFVCCNGLVVGDIVDDIRIRHTGRAHDDVIEGAYRVLEQFEVVEQSREQMMQVQLSGPEEIAYATAALSLRYGLEEVAGGSTPVTAEQVNFARRVEDTGPSLWSAFQRVQENLVKGGLTGRTHNGRRTTTRPVASIDRSVSLNRGLWVLAEEMRRLKMGEGTVPAAAAA